MKLTNGKENGTFKSRKGKTKNKKVDVSIATTLAGFNTEMMLMSIGVNVAASVNQHLHFLMFSEISLLPSSLSHVTMVHRPFIHSVTFQQSLSSHQLHYPLITPVYCNCISFYLCYTLNVFDVLKIVILLASC